MSLKFEWLDCVSLYFSSKISLEERVEYKLSLELCLQNIVATFLRVVIGMRFFFFTVSPNQLKKNPNNILPPQGAPAVAPPFVSSNPNALVKYSIKEFW